MWQHTPPGAIRRAAAADRVFAGFAGGFAPARAGRNGGAIETILSLITYFLAANVVPACRRDS
jgi:hypothetical protein